MIQSSRPVPPSTSHTLPRTQPDTSSGLLVGPRLVVLSGSPRTGSRTLAVARGLVERITEDLPAASVEIIDLAELARHLFDGDSRVAAAARTVAAADLLIVASPVYKGSYTGLLKVFLDLLPGGALRGVTAIPLVLSAAPDHSFAGEAYLRPVLVELGAAVPARSFAVIEEQIPDLDVVFDSWVVSYVSALRASVAANAGTARPALAAEPDRPAHAEAAPSPVRSDAVRSDAVRSDAVRSDAVRSDAVRSDTVRPDTVRPETTRTEPARPVPSVLAPAASAVPSTGSGASSSGSSGVAVGVRTALRAGLAGAVL
ncbi:NADPH-dependent FMN reductase [Parafrankia sp. EUN1f]|uniref:NADPH-dependent FMN reductase n=1 Tax=Parafrankia sp. EUN1f TaxID=102897 RepID=UPI0001C467F0|nr:NAD(P)H-dependent oxidoreductase [Parafrankia sp. EUN1f]EFC81027.1 NADPH-dependent FMN reductase [Parafrankia sp. EUN1f]